MCTMTWSGLSVMDKVSKQLKPQLILTVKSSQVKAAVKLC